MSMSVGGGAIGGAECTSTALPSPRVALVVVVVVWTSPVVFFFALAVAMLAGGLEEDTGGWTPLERVDR